MWPGYNTPGNFFSSFSKSSCAQKVLWCGCLQSAQNSRITVLSSVHLQLVPANYSSQRQHVSRTASHYSFLSALNQRCSFIQAWDVPGRLSNTTDLESPTEWWMSVSGLDSVSTGRTPTFICQYWAWSHKATHLLTATTSPVRELQIHSLH